jgi:hypothetical protein
MTPSPPSTRPSGSRERRSSAFIREDSGIAQRPRRIFSIASRMVLEHRRCSSTARQRAQPSCSGAAPSFRKRQASANPILVFRSSVPLSVICKTHNVYCSPVSMAAPRNLSFIFAEGAHYARILICETPRDSQYDRSSPVRNTLNRKAGANVARSCPSLKSRAHAKTCG